MELVAAALAVAEVSAKTSSKLWKLSEQWRTAPRDIFDIRDEVDRAASLFALVEAQLQSCSLGLEHSPGSSMTGLNIRAGHALRQLLHSGQGIVNKLQDFIDLLLLHDGSGDFGEIISKSRRLMWIRNSHKIRFLRSSLKTNLEGVGVQLALLNL